MTPNNTSQDTDALGAFAGVVVLVVILAILFLFTTPGLGIGVEAASAPTEIPTEIEPTTTPLPTAAPTQTPQPAPTTIPESGAQNTETDSATAGSYDPEQVARGEQLFATCAACHGPDAHGITGLGKDLVAGEFANTTPDDELVTFIMTGRPIWDPANTTMVDMPPKGGNPTFTQEDIEAIVAYIRSLQTP